MPKTKEKKEVTVNLKVPAEWNKVRQDGNMKWIDVIRMGVSDVKQFNDQKKPVETEKKPAVDERKIVDEALQTKADKRRHLETGMIELELKQDVREYNVYNKLRRMWEKIAFKDIVEGEKFRIVEGGKVITTGGHKYLSYMDFAYRNIETGELCVKVIGRRMVF